MNAIRYVPFAGRLLIGLPFAMSGLGKLAAIGPTTEMIRAAGLPLPSLRRPFARRRFPGSHRRDCARPVCARDRGLISQQLCRPESNDPLSQERDDNRRIAPDRRIWRGRAQHRQPEHQARRSGEFIIRASETSRLI
jgi:hypothetical protein